MFFSSRNALISDCSSSHANWLSYATSTSMESQLLKFLWSLTMSCVLPILSDLTWAEPLTSAMLGSRMDHWKMPEPPLAFRFQISPDPCFSYAAGRNGNKMKLVGCLICTGLVIMSSLSYCKRVISKLVNFSEVFGDLISASLCTELILT